MFPLIRNGLNFVAQGSYDRSPFAFKESWHRTFFCAGACLVILVLSTICALLITDPLLASGLMDHVYQPKGVIGGVVMCLVMYTVRDFLLAYHADIVMNQRIAQANDWLSNGTYLIRSAKGEVSHNMGQALMLTSRAKDSDDGLHVSCIALVDDEPMLITVRFDNVCMVTGHGYNEPDKIRSMLESAAGEWRYEVAKNLGITFGKPDAADATPTAQPARQRQRQAANTGPLSTPGSLSLSGVGAKH